MHTSRIDRELLRGFRRDQEPLIRERVRDLLILGWVLVPLFGWVDFLLYREHFTRFMVYRLLAAAGCLALNFANWKWNLGQRSFCFGIAGAYVVALTLIKMILETGGYETPYYAGLNLVFLSFCTMLPVGTRHLAIHTLCIYLIYLSSVLLFSKLTDVSLFMTNNMFVIATIVIGLVVSNVSYRLRLREYRVRLDLQNIQEQLKKYSEDLEHTVTESEEKYRVLVENAHDGIFVIQDGYIKFPNPRAMHLLGYSADELERISFLGFVHDEDRDSVAEKYREINGETKIALILPFRIVNKSGVITWVDMHLVGIDWKGRPGYLSFLRDVTERKRMEAELIQAQKMEAIGTLAGGIAHDFNNILTAIIGYTELAHRQFPNDTPGQQSLSQVLKASKRAKDLVAQILTFSRQTQQERKAFHMVQLLDETLGFIKAILPTTIELRRIIASDPVMIYGDPTQINQVVMNLLTNAMQSMREQGGVLEVGLSVEILGANASSMDLNMNRGAYAVLTVKDTGHGMDSTTMERIFDPFFTTKGQGEGTGMGLSVALGIVQNHGGAIAVTSEPGQGSTFKVFLPLLEKQVSERKEERSEFPGGHESILFVDDDEALIQFGEGVLQYLGYQVLARTGSMEALSDFRSRPGHFDLIITDQTMPKMTGIKLAEELLEIRPDIPIILCTGYSEQANEEKAKSAGIRKLLLKPYTIKDLAEAIRGVLDERM